MPGHRAKQATAGWELEAVRLHSKLDEQIENMDWQRPPQGQVTPHLRTAVKAYGERLFIDPVGCSGQSIQFVLPEAYPPATVEFQCDKTDRRWTLPRGRGELEIDDVHLTKIVESEVHSRVPPEGAAPLGGQDSE